MWKRALTLLAAGIVLGSTACSGDAEGNFTEEEQQLIESTIIGADELAAADCQSGADCWVAVDGVVYDVSSVSGWSQGGTHHDVKAGTDATAQFAESPHGAAQLEKLPVVGGYEG